MAGPPCDNACLPCRSVSFVLRGRAPLPRPAPPYCPAQLRIGRERQRAAAAGEPPPHPLGSLLQPAPRGPAADSHRIAVAIARTSPSPLPPHRPATAPLPRPRLRPRPRLLGRLDAADRLVRVTPSPSHLSAAAPPPIGRACPPQKRQGFSRTGLLVTATPAGL